VELCKGMQLHGAPWQAQLCTLCTTAPPAHLDSCALDPPPFNPGLELSGEYDILANWKINLVL
jgi:hypothetical protein